MLRKHVLIGAAACAALALAGLTRADVSSPVITPVSTNVVLLDDTTAAPESAPAASAPVATVTPLNSVLGKIPGYSDSGLSVTGYGEGSWTYTAHTIGGNILTDRSFDTKAESLQFDQVELNIARATDITKPFDVGFGLDQNYGWDAAYFHSNGLTIASPGKTASPVPGSGATAAIHPKTQYDLTQAFFTLSFGKIGNGLVIKGGKFVTLLSYETINPTTNPFFSHSYLFGEVPFTHTGLLATYNILDPSGPTPLTATLGFTRGWDQATRDNNGSLDATGQLNYTNGKFSGVLNFITGDEQPSGPQDGWRTEIEAVGTYQISDQLTVSYDGLYGWQPQTGNGGFGGGTGQWYGFAAYAGYKICDQLTFNARAEWFDDQDGAAPTQLAIVNTNIPNQFYEVTLGVTIHPMPANPWLAGLAIRPEARWDYSDHAGFNEGTQNDQWTAAIEGYYSF